MLIEATRQTKGASDKGKRFKGPHPADDLPFMQTRPKRTGGIDYWQISPTGNYTQDGETGGALADEYLSYVGRHPTNFNATLLTCIVREMIERAKDGQEWSGVQVGFLAAINRAAMISAHFMAPMPKGGAK